MPRDYGRPWNKDRTVGSRKALTQAEARQITANFMDAEVVATPGIINLSHDMRGRVLQAIMDFDKFEKPNDPYREHDFGSVDIEGQRFFFKIDTYDPTYRFMSEDPSDPNKTRRVMTIMRADEY